MIRGPCSRYFTFISPILNISSAMCCVSPKPETFCSLGYLDLICLWELHFIRGTEFRIFTLTMKAIIHFGKWKSIIQTVWSEKLHLIDTSEYTPGSTLESWRWISLKKWVICLQFFLHAQGKLFTSTQNTKIKNMVGVFCPCLWNLFLHSITFPWYKYISNASKVTKMKRLRKQIMVKWCCIPFWKCEHYIPVKSELQHPSPGQLTPWAFEFLENFCSNSSLPGLKSC